MGLKMKIGLGFFVVGLIFLALVIFGNVVKMQTIPPANSFLAEGKKNNSASLQQIAESTRYFNNIGADASSNSIAGNLTKELASKLSKKIVEINPAGPVAGQDSQSLIAPPIMESIDDGVAEAFKQFDRGYFLPVITKESLKIVDAKKEAVDYYISILPITLKHRAPDLNFSLDDSDFEERLPKAISAYEEIINKLYQLPVPETFGDFHQKKIGLITGQKRILEALTNQEQDPIKAILALQFSQIINDEFVILKNQFSKITNQP